MAVTLVGSDYGDAAFEASQLTGLRESNAFGLLDQIFRKELERLGDEIFDTRKTPEERERLVHARKQITDKFAPHKLVSQRIKWLEARIQEKEAKSA